jgi:hypothetical protein
VTAPAIATLTDQEYLPPSPSISAPILLLGYPENLDDANTKDANGNCVGHDNGLNVMPPNTPICSRSDDATLVWKPRPANYGCLGDHANDNNIKTSCGQGIA